MALLDDVDRRAFSQSAASDAMLGQWRTLKALLLIGYYTSEVGASQELRYDLVPARFDPDVPLQPRDRAWSSDWTGVKFG